MFNLDPQDVLNQAKVFYERALEFQVFVSCSGLGRDEARRCYCLLHQVTSSLPMSSCGTDLLDLLPFDSLHSGLSSAWKSFNSPSHSPGVREQGVVLHGSTRLCTSSRYRHDVKLRLSAWSTSFNPQATSNMHLKSTPLPRLL